MDLSVGPPARRRHPPVKEASKVVSSWRGFAVEVVLPILEVSFKTSNYRRYVDMSLIPIWSAGTIFDSLLEDQKWWGDLGGRVPWGDWNGDDHVEQVTNVAEEQVVGKCILKQNSGICKLQAHSCEYGTSNVPKCSTYLVVQTKKGLYS